MVIQIHKNELARYLIKDYPRAYKLEKERLIRWVDVPEYLIVEAEESGISSYAQGYQNGYMKGAEDKERELCESALNKTSPNYLGRRK